jgi:hypothetical protein
VGAASRRSPTPWAVVWVATGVVYAVYSFIQYRAIQRDIESRYVRTYDRFDTLWVIGPRRRHGDVLALTWPVAGLSAK